MSIRQKFKRVSDPICIILIVAHYNVITQCDYTQTRYNGAMQKGTRRTRQIQFKL